MFEKAGAGNKKNRGTKIALNIISIFGCCKGAFI